MKKLLLILTIILCSQSVFAKKTGAFSLTFSNNGIQSSVYLYVPEDYDSTKAYPMLWGWHGGGVPGETMLNMLAQIRYSTKVIIVCPDINNITTNDQFSNIYSFSYLYPIQNYSVDTTKVVITGSSLGGFYAYQIGLTNPKLVKGIIGIAPAIGVEDITTDQWENVSQVRMATILGTLDDNYDAVSDLITEIKDRGGDMLFIEKQGLDHVGSNGYYSTQEFIDDYMNCFDYVLNSTTGVEVQPTAGKPMSLEIYPNPASDYISINTGSDNNTNSEIRIYNCLGACVLTTDEASQLVDVSILPSGVYSLSVGNGSGTQTGHFIVAR